MSKSDIQKKLEKRVSSLESEGFDLNDAGEKTIKKLKNAKRKANRAISRIKYKTGDPNTKLEERSKQQVYNVAKKMEIPGRSTMTKPELIEAIRDRR